MPKSGKGKRVLRELKRVAVVAGTAAGAVFGGPQILEAIRTPAIVPPEMLPGIAAAGGDEVATIQWAVMIIVAAIFRAFWGAQQPAVLDAVADNPLSTLTPSQLAIIDARVSAIIKQRDAGGGGTPNR